MLRSIALLSVLAMIISGCGKPASKGTSHGKPSGHPTGTGPGPGTTVKPVDGGVPAGGGPTVSSDGWVLSQVSEEEKEAPYISVWRVVKGKDSVSIDDLRRVVLKGAAWEQKGTGNSVVVEAPRTEVKQVAWKLRGAGLEAEIAALPPDSHVYFRLKGKRTFDVRWVAPAGYAGEKHEYTMSVDNVVWKKSETEYFHEMTILEEELADDYVLSVEQDPRDKISSWEKHQDKAEDLGWGLGDRIYDPTKRPFEDLVKSFQRIREYTNTVEKKGGDAEEAIAWLKLHMEWSHLPPNPVSGDLDKERQEKVLLCRTAKVRMAEVNLIDRLKSGELRLQPSDAAAVLKGTDGVLSEKLARTAVDSGRFQFAWELSLLILRSTETPDWKRTSLSSLKNMILSNPKFFDEFPEAELAEAPAKFRDAVKEVSTGNFMATRNAVSILEELRRLKPGTKWTVPVEDVVAELKKK